MVCQNEKEKNHQRLWLLLFFPFRVFFSILFMLYFCVYFIFRKKNFFYFCCTPEPLYRTHSNDFVRVSMWFRISNFFFIPAEHIYKFFSSLDFLSFDSPNSFYLLFRDLSKTKSVIRKLDSVAYIFLSFFFVPNKIYVYILFRYVFVSNCCLVLWIFLSRFHLTEFHEFY